MPARSDLLKCGATFPEQNSRLIPPFGRVVEKGKRKKGKVYFFRRFVSLLIATSCCFVRRKHTERRKVAIFDSIFFSLNDLLGNDRAPKEEEEVVVPLVACGNSVTGGSLFLTRSMGAKQEVSEVKERGRFDKSNISIFFILLSQQLERLFTHIEIFFEAN